MDIERKLLAIISGDVAGYSRMMSADEAGTIAIIGACRELIGTLVVQHHGRLVDFTGDNFLAEFASAVQAADCAIAIQHILATQPPGTRSIRFRLGLHVGDVAIDGERLYGDGVNIAARLEGLAEPGGICCSKAVLDLVRGALPVPVVDGGARELKGIARPVEVAFVEAATLTTVDGPASTVIDPVAGRVTRSRIPVIAVLPFATASRDAADMDFANAVTGDVIAGLSCDERMSVVAFNSVAQYRERRSTAREMSRVLGAHYIADGNIRRLGPRMRVNVALVDAESNAEIWGGRREFEADDPFMALDDIVESMVVALASHLRLTESDRFRRRPPNDVEAWRLASLAAQVFIQNPTDSLEIPLDMARRAVDADPDYAFAWAVLGFLTAFKFPLGISTDHPADIQASLAATGRALELDSRDPMALTAHGIALQYAGRAQESLPYLQRSLRLNPSDTLTHCYYGRGMMFGGKPELGLAHFDRFQRLNPDDPAAHMAGMYHGVALMFMQHWATAEAVAREANAAAGGRNPWVWATLAIVLGGQGRVTEARAALDELARVTPHWNREFVQGFLEQCQADPVLMKPIAAILQSIWAA